MVKQPPRILVVEDDVAIRSALEIALKSEGYEFRAEIDGSDVKSVAHDFHPDLAILDVRLPVGPDGYDLGRLLRCESDVPLMFLTAADDVDARLAGFEAGGDDYLGKPFSMAELLARVQALLRRSGRVSSAVYAVGDLILDDNSRTVSRAGSVVELTRTEYDLLSLLARHPGEVFSKVKVLSLVWGFDAYSNSVVEVHLSSLRQKLEAHGPRVIHTVRSVGYVFRA